MRKEIYKRVIEQLNILLRMYKTDVARLQYELDKLKDTNVSLCERNRWYSDLIHAMTGNRDHETVPPEDYITEMEATPTGIKIRFGRMVTDIPGQDCQPKPFCKSFISELCISEDKQCAEGVCKRVQATDVQSKPMYTNCKYCDIVLYGEDERNTGYCGICDSPF